MMDILAQFSHRAECVFLMQNPKLEEKDYAYLQIRQLYSAISTKLLHAMKQQYSQFTDSQGNVTFC